MRAIKFILCGYFLLFCGTAIAQSAKAIKADFDKAFEKISYWSEHPSEDSIDKKLFYANDQIAIKLNYYTQKSPAALKLVFKEIGGTTSDDGLFRILSWDTYTGGTQHVFENVIQYQSGGKTISINDTTNVNGDYVFAYNKIYTLTVGKDKYYLATYYGIFGFHERGEGIRVFAIQNGKLNNKVRLIKTKSGLTNKLYYAYNQTLSNADIMSEFTMEYDPESKEIVFPIVTTSGSVTGGYITYKFNGQYFEKVK